MADRMTPEDSKTLRYREDEYRESCAAAANAGAEDAPDGRLPEPSGDGAEAEYIIVVESEGGIIQSIRTNTPGDQTHLLVVDHDEREGNGEELRDYGQRLADLRALYPVTECLY